MLHNASMILHGNTYQTVDDTPENHEEMDGQQTGITG
jgi:hypothetical protein